MLARFACFAGFVVIGVADTAAQEAVAPGFHSRPPTGSVQIAVADKYIYTGYVIQDQGPIVQPFFEVAEEFFTGSGLITSASAKVSFFTSLQSRQDDTSHTAVPGRWFYETEIDAGFEIQLAKRFTVSLLYVRFDSPIGAYESSNAFRLTLEIDDKDVPGWFALNPHASWLAGLPFAWNPDDGSGNYFEIGIEPEKTFASESRYPVTLALPINVAFGDDTYYPGDAFGYASIGVSVSTALAFLPKSAGEWTFAITGAYYYLGRAPAELSNDGDRNQSVFSATLNTEV